MMFFQDSTCKDDGRNTRQPVDGCGNSLLYGEINEEIFMISPVGMEGIDPGSSSEDCYQLMKGIYGLFQAARQF